MALEDGTGPRRDLTPDQRNLTKVNGGVGGTIDLLQILKDAERINTQFTGELRARWERGYRAYRSEHFAGSKYRMKQWEGRSKLFRPKTRSAVRSALQVAASALFASENVVSVEATQQSDPKNNASAKVIQELLNYRLDRTTPRGGMPWFMIAMGSVFNATVTGVTVAKPYWDFKKRKGNITRMVPKVDPQTGGPMLDPMSGQPLMVSERVETMVTSVDRPMIDLIPSENVIVDLAAPWYDPAQLSAYFSVGYPMLVGDLKAMMQAGTKPGSDPDAGVEWLAVEDATLQTCQQDYNAMGVRLAREGGQDSKDSRRDGMNGEYGIVWVRENFLRYRGDDHHFWSVGTDVYLSRPADPERAYPHLKGERPYVMGVGAIEPHMVYPQSAVESWQPLQQEANDVVNLRLDSLKQALEPIAKVKIGSLLDKTQLQPGKRGAPGAIVDVRSLDDLEFAEWPGPTGQAYGEMQNINADFDDLSGMFSGSSVQTNRTLGETVGGMRLMNASAGGIKEFDLRVWVETWCEPVLRQVVRLEQYYESDETVLAIAGERAQVWEKFGVDELTDEHLTKEVSLRVNVGLGATDPMQKIQKMQMGLTLIGGLVPFFDRPVKVKADEMVNEIMGLIGQKGGERFFEFGDPADMQGQDPAAAEAQAKMALEKMRNDTQLQLAQMNNASAEERERMKGQIALLTTMISLQGQAQAQRQEHAAQAGSDTFGHFSKMIQGDQSNKAKQSIAAAKPAPGAGAKGGKGPKLPAAGGMAGMDQIGGRLDQLLTGLKMIVGKIDELEGTVTDMARHQAAPVEIIRGPDGTAVATKRGNVVRPIQRDPKTNRVARLV